MTPRLTDPVEIGGVAVPNRLYRAPLLECAGTGPDAVDALIDELEPAAASGAGLVFQGATIVRGEGGCAAPGMTRVHDPSFVDRCERLTGAIHDYGGRIFIQLEHGGLRSLETWHEAYRCDNPGLRQLAVSPPPALLRALDHAGLLSFDPHVLSTEEVYDLAADFGRSAAYAVDAGYDGVHVAGANVGIVQQFLSPYYNRRDDEFGGNARERVRFLELVHDEIRDRAGDVPLVTKVPAETATPRFLRPRISLDDGVAIARECERIGFDAVVPVRDSVLWDMSIARGEYPDRAWNHDRFADGYDEAFGGRLRWRLLAACNRLQSRWYDFEPAWNADFCRRVREVVSIPVLAEGGIRDRTTIDRLLDEGVCDLVGMARPFYAEPRLPARLLERDGAEALCESCNNCTVPQVTGAQGVCRTPSVLERRGELEREGAYARGSERE